MKTVDTSGWSVLIVWSFIGVRIIERVMNLMRIIQTSNCVEFFEAGKSFAIARTVAIFDLVSVFVLFGVALIQWGGRVEGMEIRTILPFVDYGKFIAFSVPGRVIQM